ncbi:hypothetical protein [Desertibacillus haloalkaliphilus]|uniref:hypothetical protein n=1 Tax=Desertibacillus haloalkaliphilus TaxID=1328930 RepID=UPI001C25D5E9|nr:hypothetical protein [Desertibacillus haloalkaliphilus]MBU8907326.1 hypothetical protein [Desertibacillus haloalkaliphilus]
MFKSLVELPWVERFLPERLKPVNDELLSNAHSQLLIKETEKLLDKSAKQAPKPNSTQTFKKKEKEYVITLKIKKRKISILAYDTKQSGAAIKKRFFIECFRKYIKEKNGRGKCVEATIQYIESGKTYIRSIKKSPHFQSVFDCMSKLDDAMIGQLINSPPSVVTMDRNNDDEELSKTPSELQQLMTETEQLIDKQDKFVIDPIIQSRLSRLLSQTEMLIPDFELLDIEERHLIKRMLREDLPNLIETYVSLSPQNQAIQKESLFIAISKMELTAITLTERLEQTRLQKMEHLLKLNELRYSNQNQSD